MNQSLFCAVYFVHCSIVAFLAVCAAQALGAAPAKGAGAASTAALAKCESTNSLGLIILNIVEANLYPNRKPRQKGNLENQGEQQC